MNRILSKAMALVFGLVIAAAPLSAANAAIVLYTISGTGSGSLNGSNFSNANYSIQLTGDTAQVASCGTSCQDLGPLNQALVTITGFAPVSLSLSTRLGIARDINAFFFGRDGSTDYLDFHVTEGQENAFNFLAGYGPVTSTDVFALDQFLNVASSGGLLTLSQSGNVIFSSSAAGAVPESSTWAMMLLGFGAIGMALRRKKLRPLQRA
jgi:hypothetical protein